MSPEQIQGEEATFRSDLYALGVVLYKMLAGKLPFDGETTQEIHRKHLHERARPLKEMNPNVKVPEWVEAVVVRLLAKDPKERYPDAGALIADIERARDEPNTVVDDTGPTIPDPERATDDLDTIEDDTRPTTVRVLDLIGQRVARTYSMLAEASLSLGTRDQAPSETVPEGEIVRQHPAAGTRAEQGSSVHVTVSLGPEEVTPIPGLSDGSTEEAERASSNAGPVPAGSRTEENRRVGEDSSRQTAQGATVRPVKRAKLWIGAGLLCAVMVVGLIAALAYFLTGEDATAASDATPTSEDATEETEPETADFTLSNTLSGHSDEINSVAFSPDGSILASGGDDATVKLWEQ